MHRQAGAPRRKPKPSKRRSAPAPAAGAEIQHALDYIRRQISSGKLRPTIADLVRLLDIRQRHQPTEVLACWYDPTEPTDNCPVCHRPNTLTCPHCGHQETAEHYHIPQPTPLQEQPL